MIWVDVALKTAAFASTIIATLRAGSRAAYLVEHDAIGIMDGPVIQGGENATHLWELSEAFRHAVRLSFAPAYYEQVETTKPVLTVVEPYPLSPRPYLEKDDDETETAYHHSLQPVGVNNRIPAIEMAKPTMSSQVKRRLHQFQSLLLQQYSNTKDFIVSVPKAVQYSGKVLTMVPQLGSYWTKQAWKFGSMPRAGPGEKEEDILQESDWDYNLSTEGRLSFNSTVDDAPRVAQLSVFSPHTFHSLRSLFGISEASYLQSIFHSGNFVSFQSNSKGAARVGGVFFFTRDGAYMIKTIKNEEAKTFLKMLPKYHQHMKRHGRKSLLTRFCGMYGVRIFSPDSLDHGQLHTFVVMNAVFPAQASKFVEQRFDLKGSTVGREVSEEELREKGSNAVLKDLDLQREVELVKSMNAKDFKSMGPVTEYGLNLGVTAKAALLSQLREDVKLLVDCQVMDYSLLVGVVNMETHIKLDQSARKALMAMQAQGRRLAKSKRWEDQALWALGAPVRLVCSPPLYVARRLWSLSQRTLSSVVTLPLPYYGAGKCGIDGGLFSVLHGRRNGYRAVYYMGLIDFLQPWTTRKVLERKLKGLIGYDTDAISCVTPEEYASRFLDFLDQNIS